MSETPWHSQTHLLSPPISRGDYSTFMVKRFFSFTRVNVMPLWPWFILVAIALICPFSYLLLGWGCRSDKPILLHSAPTPPGSPVSSERPVDSGEGRGRGQLDTPRGLASRWCGGRMGGERYNTIRIGLLRRQLALKKEKEEGGQGRLRDQWPGHSVQLGGHFTAHLRPRAGWPSGDLANPKTEVASSS